MNVRIIPIQITQRLLNSVIRLLKDDPVMRVVLRHCHGNGETEFKWHVEPRAFLRSRGELHTREVVDGEITL
jgi:hypothetical protein